MMCLPEPKNLWHYFKFLCNRRYDVGLEGRAHLIELLSLITLHRAEGINKRRVGASRDGGYVMLDDFAPVTGAYSLGIGHDVSWDLDLAELGIPILQCDDSIDRPPKNHPLFTFHRARIGEVCDPAAKVESISSLLEKFHPHETDLILKADIEGAEWGIFANMDPGTLLPFRQIVVEFHQLRLVADATWRERALRAISHLSRYHLPVHVHGNSLAHLLVSQGIEITETLELTFARRNTYKLVSTDETFPGPYDKSNSFLLPDVKLGTFKFPAIS
jgi:hypothetical protein